MAGLGIPIVLCLTVIRTFLVVDAVAVKTRGAQSGVARVAQIVRSDMSRAAARTTSGSMRPPKGPGGVGASKVRSLHRRLLCMHFAAIIGQSAGMAKYLLPISDWSCCIGHRTMLVMAVGFDASLVLFLLAKTHVTNGHRMLACWEKGLVWITRLYAWVYLPLLAIILGATYPGTANDEETFCFNNITDDHTTTVDHNVRAYWATSALLILEYVLLLVLFLRPMLVRHEGTQSGGAVYRRVVLRNVVCTLGVVLSYTVTIVIASLALFRTSVENNKAAQTADITIATNQLGTLCLMEVGRLFIPGYQCQTDDEQASKIAIALPLGFGSCWKECTMPLEGRQPEETPAPKMVAKEVVVSGDAAIRVIPMEVLP